MNKKVPKQVTRIYIACQRWTHFLCFSELLTLLIYRSYSDGLFIICQLSQLIKVVVFNVLIYPYVYLGASLDSLFPHRGADVGDSLYGGWLSDSFIPVQKEQVHCWVFQELGSLHTNWCRISHFHPQMICLPLDHSKEHSFGKYTLGSLDLKIGIKCYH